MGDNKNNTSWNAKESYENIESNGHSYSQGTIATAYTQDKDDCGFKNGASSLERVRSQQSAPDSINEQSKQTEIIQEGNTSSKTNSNLDGHIEHTDTDNIIEDENEFTENCNSESFVESPFLRYNTNEDSCYSYGSENKAAPEYTVKDSDIDNIILGNYYNYQGTKRSENPATRSAFPHFENQITFGDFELMDKRRDFYRENRWLIIEKNRDNYTFISQAIACLISQDKKNTQFLIQKAEVHCEEYITQGELFACSTDSITRLEVIDLKGLQRLFETSENVAKLSQLLKNGKNILLLVLDHNHTSLFKQLITSFGDESHIAYWKPKAVISNDSELCGIDVLNWLDKTIVALCCFFYCLPYSMLHNLVLILLEQKVEECTQKFNSLEIDSESDTVNENTKSIVDALNQYTMWLRQWKDDPDSILTRLELSNYPDAETELSGIHFNKPDLHSYYRQMIETNAAFHMYKILPYIESYLMNFQQRDINFLYPNAFKDYANYLFVLHQHRLENLDSHKLEYIFEQTRYARTESYDSINFLIDLLLELYKQEDTSNCVVELVANLARQIISEEAELLKAADFNFSVIEALPSPMRELKEELQKENVNEFARQLFKLKDKLYAMFTIITRIGILERASIEALNIVFSSKFGINKAKIENSLCHSILRYQMSRLLAKAEFLIVDILKVYDFKNSSVKLTGLLEALQGHFFELCVELTKGSKNKYYESIKRIFLMEDGLQTVMYLFMCSKQISQEHGKLLLDTIAQFYLNLLNEKGNEDVRLKLEPQFKQVLNQVANQLSKDDYRQLKQYSRAKVDLAKSAINEYRYDKSLRIGWKLNKQACVFAMRYFSRR